MTVPQITAVRLGGSPALPLLVLGPSLGTSARTLWSHAATHLADSFEVVAWDLPGHGSNSLVGQPFTLGELATGVLTMVDDMLSERGAIDSSFVYAGNSVGGAVGLHLMLDAPQRVSAAVLLCTGAKIGEAHAWHERAATVRASGTSAVLDGSAARWFAPGFLDREPETGAALLHALRDADAEGYALVCEALAGHDVRHRLAGIRTPVLAVAGREDVPTPPETLGEIADGVRHGRLVVLEGVAHLAPAEAPRDVARLIRAHVAGQEPASPSVAAFEDLVAQYEENSIWTRPGLDSRSRSLVALTALVARERHEELATHVRTARANGLTNDEINELLLQAAIFCGATEALRAFRIVEGVLDDIGREEA